jgi:hypothetical protein
LGRLTESNFPDLPDEFVQRIRRKGKEGMSLSELVEEFKEWQRERGTCVSGVSDEDREFVRDELAWLAEWIRSRYPKLNFGEIRRFLREMIPVSV